MKQNTKKQSSEQLDKIITDIESIYDTGKSAEAIEDKDFREVIITGSQSIGAGHRIREKLNDKYNFVNITDSRQTIPESDKITVLYLDLRNFDDIPESFRELAKTREDVRILAVDSHNKTKPIEGFSYSIAPDYCLNSFENDIDPSISRQVAELYLNVDNAFDEEGINHNGKLIKPYFHTSVLIDYPRSRDILEGNLSSVIRKFNPEVIASRETIGIPPEDVKMFELAQPLAERLGIESVKVEKADEMYFVEGDISKKNVLLLEDVVGDASTKLKIIDAIKKANGNIESCVVLLDRKEGGVGKLKQIMTKLYALTDIDWFNFVAAEKKIR